MGNLRRESSTAIRFTKSFLGCYARGMSLSPDLRHEIGSSTESVRTLARRLAISPTTIQKWRSRQTLDDKPRARHRRETLTPEHIFLLVLLRRAALLSLEDTLAVAAGGMVDGELVPPISRSTVSQLWEEAGLARMRRWDADIRLWPPERRHTGHLYVTTLSLGVGPRPLRLIIATDRKTRACRAQLDRGEGLSVDVAERLAQNCGAVSILHDGNQDTSHRLRSIIRTSSISENPCAPWAVDQIERSNSFLKQQCREPEARPLKQLRQTLQEAIVTISLTPLRAARGTRPIHWMRTHRW